MASSAVVTGGAHGIGRAVVERLLADGAGVVVLDAELPGELGESRPGLETVAGDVRRREDVKAAMDRAGERFGGVDVVVAVAGVGELAPLLELGDEAWQRGSRRSLLSRARSRCPRGVAGSRAMASGSTSGRAGAIVVVSSTNAVFAEESTVHYSASKGALVAMVRAASLDLARHGIRINAVAPGMIRTRMAAPLTEDAGAAADFLEHVPLGRFGEPEDIAAVVRFLASEEAAYVTGTLIVADGGLTAGMKLGTDEIGAG